MGISVVTSGLFVAIMAVVIVIGRVLWPKEWFAHLRNSQQFQSSVREMRQGLAMLESEHYAEALHLFEIAAQRTPRKPAPVLLRIYVLGLQGRRGEAAAELHRARQRWSPTTLPRRLLALAELGAGEYDRAYQSAREAATQLPIVATALRTLGDVSRFLERYPEAERAYRGAMQLGSPTPYAGLAWVLAAQGRIAEAEEVIANASAEILELFEARLTLAQIHFHARRLEDALSIYQALLTEHGDVPRVLVPYGLALLESREYTTARAALEHAVAVSTEDPFAHAALAQLEIEQSDLARATLHVREALRLWPGYGAARGLYGDILKRASRYDAAEEQYREALRLNPFLAETHNRLASLLKTRGALTEAAEHQREAQRLRPAEPQPLTREILAITTREMAAVKVTHSVVPASQIPTRLRPARLGLPLRPQTTPPLTPPPAPPIVVHPPDTLPSPPQATQPGGNVPQPQPTIADVGIRSMSDIVVYPGAILLADESRASSFWQTLQTDHAPRMVLDFYRQHLQSAGWTIVRESISTLPQITGVTLLFARPGQEGTLTVGQRAQLPRVTLIISQVSHRAPNFARTTGSSGAVN